MGRSTGIVILAAALALSSAAPTLAQSVVKPESVGLSSARLQRLDAAMQEDVAQKRKAGMVVLVARHGKIAYFKAFGMADAERDRAMRTDDLFRIYSATKPMVSVALLTLYEEGKFQLHDPVEKYIPSFAKLRIADSSYKGQPVLRQPLRKITMQDIFRHTSGFPGGNRYYGPAEEAWKNVKWADNLDDAIEQLSTLPLAYEPGTEWRYGPEHEVQAYLVQKLSGMRIDEYMRTRIFDPLGMKDTFYAVPADRLSRYTVMYGPDGAGGLKPIDGALDSAYVRDAAKSPGGGSGISSTAADQFRFAQMLMNGGEFNGARILSRKTVEMMLSDQLPASIKEIGLSPDNPFGGMRYGLGIGLVGNVAASGRLGSVGTADWAGVANTNTYIDRKEDMVTVVMTQYRPGDYDWMYRVQTLTYQALVDAPPKE